MAKKATIKKPTIKKPTAVAAYSPPFKVPGKVTIYVDLTSKTARQIVQGIVDVITTTIGASGKSLSAGAIDEWRDGLFKSVLANLYAGGVWTAATEANVHRVAADMATIAVILSATDSEVTKSRLHGAFRAAKTHAVCPGMGSGAWCDFSV